MRLILKRAPQFGSKEVHLRFCENGADRGIDYSLVGSSDELRTFLVDRLELPKALALSVASEVTSDGSSHTEVDFSKDEIRGLMKLLKLEQRTGEAEAAAAK